MSNHASALPQRSGFTLVELLVVITIIAVLAALITPAVFQARRSGQISAIKAEIDLLHMAMMHYKNEYGSFPPCTSGTSSSDPAARHIRRLFPRTAASYVPVNATTPANSLVGWLGGYTKNPTDPLDLLGAGDPRVKIFEFDQNRVSNTAPTIGQFHPREKTGSPYIYIDSANYSTASFGTCDAEPGFNSETFQILSAGLDEMWDTDDDLSNFWKGTRGDQ